MTGHCEVKGYETRIGTLKAWYCRLGVKGLEGVRVGKRGDTI